MTAIKRISVYAFLIWLLTLPLHCPSLGENAESFSGASQAVRAANKIELPAPTGPFSIGTKIYDWVDDSRPERAANKAGEFRQLIVQVWYPVNRSAKPTTPYVPKLEAYRGIWEPTDLEVASRVLTHAHLDEKPLTGRQFPLVLFSHGWQGTRTEYTSIAEDLASHGFAVFGIDHPYMGRIALPNGQVTEATEDHFQNPADIRKYYGQDVKFVIDQITRLNIADPDGLFIGKLKVSQIGVIGHSSGFVAAGTACIIDRRILACANVDAPGFSAKDLNGLRQPLLWVRLEKAGPVPAEFLKNRSEPVYELQLNDANHGSVEDWDYLESESYQQRKTAGERLQILRKYLNAFFGKYLQDQKADILAQASTNPDITFKIYEVQ